MGGSDCITIIVAVIVAVISMMIVVVVIVVVVLVGSVIRSVVVVGTMDIGIIVHDDGRMVQSSTVVAE